MTGDDGPSANGEQQKPQKKQVCRFYVKNGCRAGDACPYLHSPEKKPQSAASKPAPSKSRGFDAQADTPQRSYQAPAVDSSKVVQRPRPRVEDPRSFQVGQIQRRFKPAVTEKDDATEYSLNFRPTDPDFPYEIEALECVLCVPKTYPEDNKPSLRVKNKDIPRGFQINIEKGFDLIATDSPEATLLGLMSRLDKQLESILSGEMAETIKIVAHRGQPSRVIQPQKGTVPPKSFGSTPALEPALQPAAKPAVAKPVVPVFTSQQKTEAQAKRQTNVRQLEARFGRLQSFAKAPDGFSYTLPFDSPKRATWPMALQSLRSLTLLLPELFPLEPSTILLDSDGPEARTVEDNFKERSVAGTDATLTQQINYLSTHIKEMSAQRKSETVDPPASSATGLQERQEENGIRQSSEQDAGHQSRAPERLEDDRTHIQVIPRPPEWAFPGEGDESEFSDSDGYSYDSGDETEEATHMEEEVQTASAPAERGILLSFPQLELHGIELMEVTTLNFTIKCERCKETMDIERLRNNIKGDASGMRDVSCRKCANGLAVGFRADLIHASSVRAGYLDLDGCTVIDMLPSNFTPTCAECSTPHPAPGVVSVRGESTMAICRECHKKMTFRIPEVKFLLVSAAAIRASRAPGRKKARENLGISVGTELPRRGKCKHYGKSFRWFRFSCCRKVFACDKCHDEASDHPNEHANRMICGYCSREQNYRPEDCGACHSPLTGKRGTGFWEGGKGTRDKVRMNRKDPRKYKRRPGGASKKM